jgi:Cu/Zn superoxide dismutase
MMKLNAVLLAAGAVVISATAVAVAQTPPTPVNVPITAQNGSGETGTAVLTQMPDGVQVVVSITGAPSGVAQPTHIHMGTCSKLNPAPKYPLSNTVDGKSTTMVKGVKLSDLTSGQYAINIHKSANDIGTYVACGNIAGS